MERRNVAGPAEGRVAKIRESNSAIDEQTQRLEERVERVQRRTEKDREGEECESRAAFADKFKRGIEQASEQLEEKQSFYSVIVNGVGGDAVQRMRKE